MEQNISRNRRDFRSLFENRLVYLIKIIGSGIYISLYGDTFFVQESITVSISICYLYRFSVPAQ